MYGRVISNILPWDCRRKFTFRIVSIHMCRNSEYSQCFFSLRVCVSVSIHLCRFLLLVDKMLSFLCLFSRHFFLLFICRLVNKINSFFLHRWHSIHFAWHSIHLMAFFISSCTDSIYYMWRKINGNIVAVRIFHCSDVYDYELQPQTQQKTDLSLKSFFFAALSMVRFSEQMCRSAMKYTQKIIYFEHLNYVDWRSWMIVISKWIITMPSILSVFFFFSKTLIPTVWREIFQESWSTFRLCF